MTAKELNEPSNKLENAPKRRRRHWYDHEKMDIISAYDRGELYPAKGKPNCVTDPKSKEVISVFLIEGWKDQFRNLGLIKGVKKEIAQQLQNSNVQNLPTENSAVQTLLVRVLLENQELKEVINHLKRPGVPKRRESEKQTNV